MAMLTLNGIVQNVLDTPSRTDKKTGEVYPARSQVQIMAENTLQNGQKKLELVTLTTDHPEAFRRLEGHSVSIPVGVFASGAVSYYALKNQAAPEA